MFPWQFQLSQFFRAHIVATGVAMIAFFTLVTFFFAYVHLTLRLDAINSEFHLVHQQVQMPRPIKSHWGKDQSILPPLDSAVLAEALQQAATESNLKLDEISYSLDASPAQPFLRYRTSLLLTAKYSNIRNFVSRFQRKLEQTSLDSISCKRTAIDDAELSCEIAVSTFYRKAIHG
jgi:hypothetical protein